MPPADAPAPAVAPSPLDDAAAVRLLADGFVHILEPRATLGAAWRCARGICAAAVAQDSIGAGMPALEVVGEFAVPPPGVRQRPFQALHMDFGLPVVAGAPVDVARFTALHVMADHPPTSARTRIVPLGPLLCRRDWPSAAALRARLRRYGELQGAGERYVEGILARVVEAADGQAALPRAADRGFLCGMEFASRAEERGFLAAHGLDLDGVEREVALEPGQLLVFDNLATAHGRAGVRRAGELHQLCLGYRSLDPRRQETIRDRVLGAFAAAPPSRAARA